ncbi:DNA helicase RecQ [Pseudomarimonas arenosa]|uniref:DNA helicase RecQ n=1 Tax=Pseudomarimonas arenosa TaxID=2774145 RepID=A0AAW3ZLT7_9GAMM|nr:DNA helicase RecQ [Pseudomarimonas arenosa]MBD8527118.1 DNA helicase RecQ [Pseudomarimonas arenosa]
MPDSSQPQRLLDLLQHTWGYSAFRGEQQAVIEALVAGRDCLVLMPTGGGKSLCYQLPALARPGCAIVVSPLIALMQDQVEALQQLGVRAAFLNSSLSAEAAREVTRHLRKGELDLLYVAPERLLSQTFLEQLDEVRIALFAIDEAHCVSQWGHDFRPEYRQLDVLHRRWPEVPRIALTATADLPTRTEIIERLNLESAEVFLSSFDRPNICYRAEVKRTGLNQLFDFLAGHRDEAGIVYCLSRREVDRTADELCARGIRALPYHAGMDSQLRAEHQRRFLREEGLVMVATIAFGMGIDKPDVRFVAHMNLPKSIEGYYQETGRAGRDGEPAEAWLCYSLADVVNLSRMIDESEASEARKWAERRRLDALLGLVETTQCRRQLLLASFGESYPQPCGNCDNCLEPPETWDATREAQQALSCVYRSGQRFGSAHLIDILRGGNTAKIRDFGHDRLSTYGIGAQHDANTWRSVFRQLLAAGLLQSTGDGIAGLRLTQASRQVLRGEQSVYLRRDRLRSRGKQPATERTAPQLSSPAAERRFVQLRALRQRLANEQSVPAYIIFHDTTLRAIAEQQPLSLEQLATVAGVGDRKLERYGRQVIEALQAAHEV